MFSTNQSGEDTIGEGYETDLGVSGKEDEGNGLWEVYNRVQESLVQGKYQYLGGNKKFRKA
mgnify:CR=1 FL=1